MLSFARVYVQLITIIIIISITTPSPYNCVFMRTVHLAAQLQPLNPVSMCSLYKLLCRYCTRRYEPIGIPIKYYTFPQVDLRN